MKENVNRNEPSPTKETMLGGRGRAVATIVVMAAVVIVLAVAGVKSVFFGKGEDADELRAYEDIMRYERGNELDSLHDALAEYFDVYNADAFHYSQLKALNDEFVGEYDEWRTVERRLSLDGVRSFLDHYPEGRFRVIAERCEDSLYYVWACGEGTVEAIGMYLKYFADGGYVEEAEKKLEELRDGMAAVDEVKEDEVEEDMVKEDEVEEDRVKEDEVKEDRVKTEEKDEMQDKAVVGKDVKDEESGAGKPERENAEGTKADASEEYELDDGWE